jgi:D-ribose pyranase
LAEYDEAMKRAGILNAELARVIAGIGHGQTILIADAGMPCPAGVHLIDLAVTLGVPSFDDVFAVTVKELKVERFTIAEELVNSDHAVLKVIRSGLVGCDEHVVSHDALKKLSSDTVAFIRTGEATPYANVLLSAGVVF